LRGELAIAEVAPTSELFVLLLSLAQLNEPLQWPHQKSAISTIPESSGTQILKGKAIEKQRGDDLWGRET